MSDINEGGNANDLSDAELGETTPVEVPSIPGMYGVGTMVRFISPVIQGSVERYHMSGDQKTFSYIVKYTDENGQEHERAFTHNQIEQI